MAFRIDNVGLFNGAVTTQRVRELVGSAVRERLGFDSALGKHLGTASSDVPDQMKRYETATQQATQAIDKLIPEGTPPVNASDLDSVLELAASVHGEWVRIHPFANGNSRIARLWANWALVRYGLPAGVRVKPRPVGGAYAIAAEQSMGGNHIPMKSVLVDYVRERLQP